MKAIIPVAGIGSRLKPHTTTQPKSLIPVAGKPILGHILYQKADRETCNSQKQLGFGWIVSYSGNRFAKGMSGIQHHP